MLQNLGVMIQVSQSVVHQVTGMVSVIKKGGKGDKRSPNFVACSLRSCGEHPRDQHNHQQARRGNGAH